MISVVGSTGNATRGWERQQSCRGFLVERLSHVGDRGEQEVIFRLIK